MIQEIRDKAQWNEFLLAQPTQAGIFLQSWEWGEFQAALGRKIWRLGITRNTTNRDTKSHELAGVGGIVRTPLPLGRRYLYSPRGPVIDQGSGIRDQVPGDFIEYIKNLATQEQAIFWRSEPPALLYTPANEFLRSLKFVRAAPVQPPQTLIVDLTQSEEELLVGMHEKTRYNIRLAARKGVELRVTSYELRAFEEFWKMMQETAKRDKFRTHSKEYYRKMLSVLSNPSQPSPGLRPPSPLGRGEGEGQRQGTMHVRFHATYHESAMLAAAIVAYFGDTATYLHGASSYEHRALMGPYALHWAIMQQAKKNGYKFYDLWGISSQKSPSPSRGEGWGEGDRGSWAGITRFKTGFGGRVVNYPGTFDLPFSQVWYAIYRMGRKLL